MDGGGGVNTVSYGSAMAGVTVSLALQRQAQDTVGDGSDTLSTFQNLTGSAYADALIGDGNSNVITGAGGDDTLTGGLGADTFVMTLAGGAVTVTDFSHAQGDRIDLSALYRYVSLPQLLATATQVSADTVIDLGGGHSLTLKGASMAGLSASDFIFTPDATIPVDAATLILDPILDMSLASGPLVQFTAGAGGVLVN